MPSTSGAPRRGRRPGTPDTRATILDAARSAFAEKGFAGTTIRAVALVGIVRSPLQPGGERLLTQGFVPVVSHGE